MFPAVSAIGVAKDAVCQPAEVSLSNVTVPRSVPSEVHSRPVWVPVLPSPL